MVSNLNGRSHARGAGRGLEGNEGLALPPDRSWSSGLRGDGAEVIGDFAPVVDADKTGCGEVVRCGVEQSLALKAQ